MSAGKTNMTRSEIFAANKQAFDDVIGDPFAVPEPKLGHYQHLKARGLIAAMKNNFDEGKSTRNAATPNSIDFFCDVENVITRNLSAEELSMFTETYLFEVKGILNDKERSEIEQRLGRLFRARKISPVSRYFKTIRQAGGGKKDNGCTNNCTRS